MLSTVDNVALKVSHAALNPEAIPLILESDPAHPSSELTLPQQHSSLQRSCDAAGLQSSLRWTDVQLDNGQATLLVGALGMLCVCSAPQQSCMYLLNCCRYASGLGMHASLSTDMWLLVFLCITACTQ